MSLTSCPALFGHATLLDADPMVETYPDVLCVPHGVAGASAGLYDRGRKLVTAAGYFRASPDPLPLGSSFTTLDATEFDFADDGLTYLFLGTLTGHYGHFILASMARLWALRFAPDPRLRFVVLNPAPLDPLFELPFLRDILGVPGLDGSNVVGFDRPTRIARLVVPSPAIEEHNFSHRVFARLCNRIGDLLASPLPPSPRAAPVFLSKARLNGGVSRVVNEAELCDRLAARGVEIVFPEQLAFPDQVRLFRDAPLVTGWAGSAMHTSIFSPGCDMLALSLGPTPLSNQRLLDQANGARSLAFFPEGDLLPGPVHPDFHHSHLLRDPARTADELLARIDAALRPAATARPRPPVPQPAGRVLFEHLFTRAAPVLTEGEAGWGDPEPDHTWTLGPESTLTLPRPDTQAEVRLEMELTTILLPPHLVSRPLTVHVNGTEAARFAVSRSGEYVCMIPQACLAADRLLLRLVHPLSVPPRDLGLNADARPIGIAFKAVRLREVVAGDSSGKEAGKAGLCPDPQRVRGPFDPVP